MNARDSSPQKQRQIRSMYVHALAITQHINATGKAGLQPIPCMVNVALHVLTGQVPVTDSVSVSRSKGSALLNHAAVKLFKPVLMVVAAIPYAVSCSPPCLGNLCGHDSRKAGIFSPVTVNRANQAPSKLNIETLRRTTVDIQTRLILIHVAQ